METGITVKEKSTTLTFNKNMRCMETQCMTKGTVQKQLFNTNMRCMETYFRSFNR